MSQKPFLGVLILPCFPLLLNIYVNRREAFHHVPLWEVCKVKAVPGLLVWYLAFPKLAKVKWILRDSIFANFPLRIAHVFQETNPGSGF